MKATGFGKSIIMGIMILSVGAFITSSRGLANLDSGLVAYWSSDEGMDMLSSGYDTVGNVYCHDQWHVLNYEYHDLEWQYDCNCLMDTIYGFAMVQLATTAEDSEAMDDVNDLSLAINGQDVGHPAYYTTAGAYPNKKIYYHWVINEYFTGPLLFELYSNMTFGREKHLRYGGCQSDLDYDGDREDKCGGTWGNGLYDGLTSCCTDVSYEFYYASGRENQAPTAFIDEISPNPPAGGEEVTFTGHGEDMDGSIVGYNWRSSIDGHLSTDSSFSRSGFTVGSHTIYFRAQDERCVWSEEVSESLLVEEGEFIRGDYNGDGAVLTNDPLVQLGWIFGVPNKLPPPCMDAADYDDDGAIFTNDPLASLQWLFGVPGAPPPSPPTGACGLDPTEDALDCEYYPICWTGVKGATVAAYQPSVSVKDAENRLVVDEVTPVDGLVRVPVDLTVTEAVCGFDLSLGYNASLLQFVEVVGGDSYDFYAVDIRQEGVVRIGGVPDIEMGDFMGAGTHRVAEVLFSVKDSEIDVELNWEKVEVYGANVEALSVEWVDGVLKAGVGLPTQFALRQNYPNPFNPTTQIKYDLPVDCHVRLEIYNILSQKVATLVDGEEKAGYKTAKWDASSFSSGIYFYRLQAGDFVQTRKMVVIR